MTGSEPRAESGPARLRPAPPLGTRGTGRDPTGGPVVTPRKPGGFTFVPA